MVKSDFKRFDGKELVLQLKGGEELRAKITFVDDEYDDLIVDVIATNQPEHYQTPNAAYTVNIADILSVSD